MCGLLTVARKARTKMDMRKRRATNTNTVGHRAPRALPKKNSTRLLVHPFCNHVDEMSSFGAFFRVNPNAHGGQFFEMTVGYQMPSDLSALKLHVVDL